jgi:hypothetical protein
MQEKLLKMTSEHRMEMASKRGRPTQLEQGRDGGGVVGEIPVSLTLRTTCIVLRIK